MAEEIVVTYQALKDASKELTTRYNDLNEKITQMQAMNDNTKWQGVAADQFREIWRVNRRGMEAIRDALKETAESLIKAVEIYERDEAERRRIMEGVPKIDKTVGSGLR